MNKPRCEGKRRQSRKGTYGIFRCMRKATGVVETQVGFIERHHCCDDAECYRSITGGYPAKFTPAV